MKAGLLWFDDDPGRDLPQKIARAAARYAQKYGRIPNTVCVHPTTAGELSNVGPVRVVRLPSVLRDHFWIGEEQP